jgi:hypothetical protein
MPVVVAAQPCLLRSYAPDPPGLRVALALDAFESDRELVAPVRDGGQHAEEPLSVALREDPRAIHDGAGCCDTRLLDDQDGVAVRRDLGPAKVQELPALVAPIVLLDTLVEHPAHVARDREIDVEPLVARGRPSRVLVVAHDALKGLEPRLRGALKQAVGLEPVGEAFAYRLRVRDGPAAVRHDDPKRGRDPPARHGPPLLPHAWIVGGIRRVTETCVNGLVALLGSLARGDFHPLSDADTAVLDAGEDWAEAERAAHEAAEAFGVEADVSFWEELFGRVRAEALRDGVACG